MRIAPKVRSNFAIRKIKNKKEEITGQIDPAFYQNLTKAQIQRFKVSDLVFSLRK